MALIGVARTAPTGATVVLNSGIVYYVHGMERWPDDVDGKVVTATGVIKTVAITPAGWRRPFVGQRCPSLPQQTSQKAAQRGAADCSCLYIVCG